ncbi:MAG: hypothetical protein AMXMBFR36_15190 [Acidobacteriota bacterium]
MTAVRRTVELVEREPFEGDNTDAFFADVQAINGVARGKVAITPPNPLSGNRWRLVSEGWIGQIPVSDDLLLVIRPKVSIGNLFRMIEVAYRLPGLEFPEGQGVSSSEIADLFDKLAGILARRTLARVRRGLHREYLRYEESLPYVRGRLLPLELVRAGRGAAVPCRFEDQTSDIEDNQILLWTLRRIARAGIGREETRANVRQSIRTMAGAVELVPFRGKDCLRRFYQRLNFDYEPLHGLCRFFLEALGPTHETGDATMVPFLVDMARLFELFVAEWLSANLPSGYTLSLQERIEIDLEGRLEARADLLIRSAATGRALAVLDTKYKSHETPKPEDLYQINAYADLVRASSGFLVYPKPPAYRFKSDLGGTLICSLSFDIGDVDLESSGRRFVAELLPHLEKAEASVA